MTTLPHPVPGIGLDHVGLIVPDLQAAHRLFEQLGFTLTRRADHTRTNAQGETVPAGSAQHSVMLQDGYIELMQITDPHAGHPLTRAMQQRFGLHVFAFSSGDPHRSHDQLAQAGVAVGPVMDWARPVPEAPGNALARFRFFDTPWQAGDPAYLCWVQHLTPDLVRLPHQTAHANTAAGLTSVTYTGPRAALVRWHQQLVRCGAQTPTAGSERAWSCALGTTRLEFEVDDRLPQVLPTGLGLAVTHIARLADHARAAGLPLRRQADGVDIDLGADYGLRLTARQA